MTWLENMIISTGLFSNMFLTFFWVTIKSGIILGLALLLTTGFRGTTAARLHLILCAAILAVLMLPALTLVFPQWQLSSLINLPAQLLPNYTVNSLDGTIVGDGDPSAGLPWQFWALTVWFLGVLFNLGRTALGSTATGQLVRRAITIANPDLITLIENCRERLGIRRPVRLAKSSVVTSPFVWGTLQPVIIIPEAAERWDRRDLEYALLHEMAHIKRLDSLWFLFATITTAIYWINPLVWMTRKRLIIEAEKTCDDHVLNSGTDQTAYAQHLLKVLDLFRAKRQIAPVGVGMARRSHMEGRLMSILSDRKRSTGLKWSIMAVTVLVTMMFVLPLSGIQVSADEKAQSVDEQIYPGPDDIVKCDNPPEMIFQQPPEYPESAAKNGIQGVVWVKALVDTTGQVVKAVVDKSSGHEALDEAALKAAYMNKFKPAMQGEKPISVWVSYKINFELNDHAEKKEKGDG